jgi:hypothetical protein
MPATRPAWFRLFVAGALLALALPQKAGAAENGAGFYLLGSRGALAGVLPPPGLYFQNDVYLYSGTTGANVAIPFNGRIVADVKANAIFELPTLLWSTPLQILGGNLGLSATIPAGGPAIDAGVSLTGPRGNVISRDLHDSDFTVGDPVFAGTIGWHAGNFHWSTGVTVNVPIGDYHPGALANIAFHRWGADVFAAGTWLDPHLGIDLSGAVGVTFNGTNPVTDYTTGTEFHLELAASKILSNGFQFGAIGYYYQQVTGDSGSGARLGDFKGRTIALGGTAAYTFKLDGRDITTRVKVLREFDVENRLEGTAGFLTVSFPIAVNAAPTKPLVTRY